MITTQQIEEIGGWLEDQLEQPRMEMALRGRYPHLHFTFCMDDDVVTAEPIREHGTFNLYLVDSSNHCLALTHDLELATGLVVAVRDEE
jgi:hypothetical protein